MQHGELLRRMGFVEFLYLHEHLAVFAQSLLPRLKMVIQGPGAVIFLPNPRILTD
jgi:hypothetical protein